MIDTVTAAYAALALRVTMGVYFLVHAGLKLFVFTPAGAAAFFGSLGLPPSLAYLTILAELVGGSMLIAGVMTRWVSLALVPILIGAVWVHFGAGFIFSNQGGGWEFPLFWAVALFVQALLGDGAYALRHSGLTSRPAVAVR